MKASSSRALVVSSALTGVLFGVGLVVAGMTTPHKVVGFLDVFGRWDPSLAFVMIGAIAVHALLYRLARRRTAPLFARAFSVPTRRDVDVRLVAGAALFGAGWGLSGICPGPGLVASAGALRDGALPLFAFVLAMFVGMKAFTWFDAWAQARATRNTPEVR